MPDNFDPFSDRLARDIRNGLSEALVRALTRGDPGDMEETAAHWLATDLPSSCRRYVLDRLERYRQFWQEVPVRGITDAIEIALAMWNQGLLFETHEVLEDIWQSTSGERREAFKGLIQAAVVFIHAQHGNNKAAHRLALRSRELLGRYGRSLPEIANLDVLVRVLKSPSLKAPVLIGSTDRE